MMDATKLDERGRCCGRKPIPYKRGDAYTHEPHQFCDRCDRSYNTSGEQISDWKYIVKDGECFPRNPGATKEPPTC